MAKQKWQYNISIDVIYKISNDEINIKKKKR